MESSVSSMKFLYRASAISRPWSAQRPALSMAVESMAQSTASAESGRSSISSSAEARAASVAFPRPPSQPHIIMTPKHTANAAPKTWSSRDDTLKNLYAEIMDFFIKDILPLREDAEWRPYIVDRIFRYFA